MLLRYFSILIVMLSGFCDANERLIVIELIGLLVECKIYFVSLLKKDISYENTSITLHL